MKKTLFTCFLLVSITSAVNAQVDEIKSGSRSSGRGGRESSSASGSGVFFDLFFNIFIGEMITAQQRNLERRDEVPGMVSLDLMLQVSAQPSNYYIAQPRVRGNWGLFSTDFRLNYLVEEDIEGFKHIRTNEWQVLQLNLVSTKDVFFRVGGGFIQEAYEQRQNYAEWTTALQIHPSTSRFGGALEYRDAEIRKEVNTHMQYKLFDRGALHGFATAGVVYQRWYSTVTTWGLQGGVIFRLY